MARVKATSYLGSCAFFEKSFGHDVVVRVLATMSADDRAALEMKILPSTWLDYHRHIRFMLAADALLGTGDHSLIARAAAHVARTNLTGIYKVFISIAKAQSIFVAAAGAWRQYYDKGTLTTENLSSRGSELRLTDFRDIPLHHDSENTPYIAEYLRMARYKNPQGEHVRCIARGNTSCLWRFKWDP